MGRNFVLKWLLCFLVSLIFFHCNNTEQLPTELKFHIRGAYGHQVYLETIGLIDEKKEILDSAAVKSGDEWLVFTIPASEERPYKLKIKDVRFEIFFINDWPEITIEAHILKPQDYIVKHSPATISVKNFLASQKNFADQIREKVLRTDSLKTKGVSDHAIDSMMQKNKNEFLVFSQQYINYTDTVSSPGAFLYMYNSVDFGKNYGGLKNFILRAAKRFPDHSRIQKLKEETLAFIKVFEEEFNVGDHLPDLVLPDNKGGSLSISSLKGKYVFMDFWSVWCGSCLKYELEKEHAKKVFPEDKFEIVSIALDTEKENWKTYTEAKKFNWPQLIDEKMWRGETIRLLKIDSIPFNFFLSPEGKILSKAIQPDSVVPVISRMMK